MNSTRWVFKFHKWLAVGTGVITFVWFLSGIFMTIPPRLLRAMESTSSPAQQQRHNYRDAKISLAEAIARVDQEKGASVEVTGAEWRIVEGQLYYRISTGRGVYLVSSRDASLLAISEDVARRIAASKGADPAQLGSVTKISAHDSDYNWGPLPAWRFEVADARKTAYYVEVDGGDVRKTHRWGRILGFLTGMHSLEFLSPYMGRGKVRFIMWVFSIFGTIMTLFGFWILWIQFQNWRHRKLT